MQSLTFFFLKNNFTEEKSKRHHLVQLVKVSITSNEHKQHHVSMQCTQKRHSITALALHQK